MKFVSFYDVAPTALLNRARLEEFYARGVLLAAGPLGNPPDSAMGIFTTREAAEEFVAGDPFVINGLERATGMSRAIGMFFAPTVSRGATRRNAPRSTGGGGSDGPARVELHYD